MVLTLVGCGGATASSLEGTTDPTDASHADARPSDAGGDARLGDGGCLADEPVEGSACASGQSVCSRGDPCCIGYMWSCDTSAGVWRKLGLGCACRPPVDAGSFTCGTRTCGGASVCLDQAPGIRYADGGTPPNSYSCADLPAQCRSTPTCACVLPLAPSSCLVPRCQESGGHVTLYCMGQ